MTSAEFKALPPQEQLVYEERARDATQQGFTATAEPLSSELPADLPKRGIQRLVAFRCENSMARIRNHPRWNRGLNIGNQPSSLRREFVPEHLTYEQVAQQAANQSGPDPIVVPNPPGTSIPETVSLRRLEASVSSDPMPLRLSKV